MKRFATLLLLATTLYAGAKDDTGLSAGISAAEVSEHVKILASDEYEGRRPGQAGCEKAARYIETRFEEIGLSPIGDDETFRQTFDLPVRAVDPKASSIVLRAGSREHTFAAGRDWKPFPSTQTADLANLEVVFAGYGIKAGRQGYDDYEGLDVKGKAVLLLRHCPRYEESREVERKFARSMSFMMKARTAVAAGAAAVILVNDTRHGKEGEDDVRVPWTAWGMPAGTPCIFAKADVARALLEAAGREFDTVQKTIDETGKPQSFPISEVRMDLSVRQRPVRSANILGLLPGSDPKLGKQFIIVGAHYDHLGTDGFGAMDPNAKEKLWNGADDNASGTAGLIELAEHFALTEPRPKRSLLFIAFTGEEMGVLGSRHYVGNPLLPHERCVLMLNMDMIGRLRENRLHIGGVGTSPVFDGIITRANEGIDLDIVRGRGGMAPSDNMVFFRKRLSTLFFNTGLHRDLHRVTDDWEKQNFEGAAKTLAVAMRVIRAVGDLPERPTFVNARSAILGVNIDRRDEGEGVLLAGVSPDLGAAKAGLRAGDRVIEFAGKPTLTRSALLRELRTRMADEEVTVKVRRGDEVLSMQVVLSGR